MKNYWTQSKDNVFVAAHRGWSQNYPENTMEAFRAAAELGVDQIETDIRITRDGELVIFHDESVERTTDGRGKVCELTLAQIKALDAGVKKNEKFKGARVPTFIEFMEYVKDLPDITIDLELKEYPTEGKEELSFSVCDRVLEIVDRYGFTDRCVINSFSGKLNEYVYKKYGKKYRQHVFFPKNLLGECTIDPYSYAYCACVFSDAKADYDFLRSYGVQPWAGAGVKDEKTLARVIENGAELITCNNPDVILSLLREKGLHK